MIIPLPQIQKHEQRGQEQLFRGITFQYFPVSNIFFPCPHTANLEENVTQYVLTQVDPAADVSCIDNQDQDIVEGLHMNQPNVVDLDTNVAHEGVNVRMIKMRYNETETIPQNSKNKRCPTKSIPEKTQEAHK